MSCGKKSKFWNEKKIMDKCSFCLEKYWMAWYKELMEVEDEAENEELQSLYDARDSLSKSERDLALARRTAATNLIFSCREARIATIKAIEAIKAENYKKEMADKATRGINVTGASSLPDSNYEQAMERAKVAKMEQEISLGKLRERQGRWKYRLQQVKSSIEECNKPLPIKGPDPVAHTSEKGQTKEAPVKTDQYVDSLITFKDTYTQMSNRSTSTKKKTPRSVGKRLCFCVML